MFFFYLLVFLSRRGKCVKLLDLTGKRKVQKWHGDTKMVLRNQHIRGTSGISEKNAVETN